MKIDLDFLTDIITLQIKAHLVMFNFISDPFTLYATIWLLFSTIILGAGGVIFKKFLERPFSRLLDYFLIKVRRKETKKIKKQKENGKIEKDISE